MTAICPKCMAQGEEGAECPNDHHHFVESKELANAPEQHLLGELVGGQYIPLKLIGEGGMGQIYRAKAKYTGKTVALKILKSEFMEDETLKDRFFREAEVISAIEHPNIVKLYSCAPDVEHNTIYIAMELLTGRTLFSTLRRGAPKLEYIIKWFVEISDALGAAHRKGIFHRDLKPENVFISPSEDGTNHAKVLDFGFARLQGAAKKLTMAGVAFGTPHYMSPEQAMGLDDITAAVDVYAIGVMLFQAITGHVPYDSPSGSPMDVMYAQVHQPTPPVTPRAEYTNVPNSLIECIKKCMEKKVGDRYPDGDALHAELVKIQKEIESGVVDVAKPEPAAKSQPQVASAPQALAVSGDQAQKPAPAKFNNMIIAGVAILILLLVITAIILVALTM